MASQDVIELGSSDDEPEPAPKKAKIKPLPNSMVQIPSGNLKNIHFKHNSNSNSKKNNSAFQNKKDNTSSSQNPYLMKTVRFVSKPKLPILKGAKVPYKINNSPPNIVTNPIKIVNNVVRFAGLSPKITQVKSINPFAKQLHNLNVNRTLTNSKSQSQKFLKKLPPSITVTKTTGQKHHIQPVFPQQIVVKKRKIAPSTQSAPEILTVDLDDDDTSEPRPHPVWCLKPEENTNDMEIKNNSEPEPQTVEITIEDSPIKPLQNKFDNNEIGRILEITIDDSPVKLPQASKTDNQSDSSADDKTVPNKKVPHSRKKLEYPNEDKDQSGEQMEIDVTINNDTINEVCEVSQNTDNSQAEPVSGNNVNAKNETVENIQSSKLTTIDVSDSPAKHPAQNITEDNMPNKFIVIEVNDSPAKQSTENIHEAVTKDKMEKVKSVPKGLERKKEEELSSAENDIHPVYQSFIDLCFKIEDTDDMKKIVEKKIKAYYKEVPKQYTESEEFIEMVLSKILAINADPDRMYLYIKDIVDELNMQRKLIKSKNMKEKVVQIDEEIEIIGVEDPKKRSQIRKLEKALKKLHRAIQKLEEQEVDFDDEADSVYLLTESEEGNSSKDSEISSDTDKNVLLQRYKERVVRVHAKLCKLTNTKMPSEPSVHIEARPGRPKGAAQRLEKWINKKVPIGTPLPFPDFHDVLKCVREANDADKLGWSEMDIMEEARDLFMRCGKKLQRRRQENEWRVAASRISAEVDPAQKDSDLQKKLDENKKVASVKESQIIDKYVDRQNKLNLEPQEIEEKDADKSPNESDDDIIEESEEVVIEDKTSNVDINVDLAVNTKVSISNKASKIKTDNENIANSDTVSNDKSDNVSTLLLHKVDKITKGVDAKICEKVGESENKLIGKDMEPMEIVEKPEKDINVSHEERIKEKNDDKHDSVELLSDDENDKEKSGIEVGELLTVKCFETEGISTVESSDTDCPIAISDTVEASSSIGRSGNGNCSSDVVSVEQTITSDSDGNQKGLVKQVDENKMNKVLTESSNMVSEVVSLVVSPLKANRKSNEEYTVAIEDILLASDDESIPDAKLENEAALEKEILASSEDNYINLKDDELTIEENAIESSSVLITRRDVDDRVLAVPTESNSSPSVVSLEDTCNTDTTDDAIAKQISASEEIVTSSDDKNENQNEITEVTNLSSVDSICLPSEELSALSNDIPEALDCDKETRKSGSEKALETSDASPVTSKVKNDSEENGKTTSTDEIVRGLRENCKSDVQKHLTIPNSASQSLDAATEFNSTS